jgi:hypothetical protein
MADAQPNSFKIKLIKDAIWKNVFTGVDVSGLKAAHSEEEDPTPSLSKTEPSESGFKSVQHMFLSEIEPFFTTFPFLLFMARTNQVALIDSELKGFCEKNAISESKSESESEYTIKYDYEKLKELNIIFNKIVVASQAINIIPNSFIMQLCSLFDVLISSIVSELIRQKPSILDASERKIEYADLFNFSSIEEIKLFKY